MLAVKATIADLFLLYGCYYLPDISVFHYFSFSTIFRQYWPRLLAK